MRLTECLHDQDVQQRLMVQRAATKQAVAEALAEKQAAGKAPDLLDSRYLGTGQQAPGNPGSSSQVQQTEAGSLTQQQAWAQYHIGPQLKQEPRQQQPAGGGWSGWQN